MSYLGSYIALLVHAWKDSAGPDRPGLSEIVACLLQYLVICRDRVSNVEQVSFIREIETPELRVIN